MYRQYLKDSNEQPVPTVIASTANPYKFSASVLEALQADCITGDDFSNLEALERLTGLRAPVQLRELRDKPERFFQVISQERTGEYVLEALGIGG